MSPVTAAEKADLAQAWRFVRIFLAVFIPEIITVNGYVGRSAILAAIPGAIETAYRMWRPVKSKASA